MATASTASARARTSRGYRNKNPGNIDYSSSNKWQGQVGKEAGANGRFAVFSSHEYGIRALAMLLTTYQDRHGLRTVREIVNRWAPPVENQTSAYAAHVADLMGKSETAILNLHRYDDMRGLVEAIITHELGGMPYASATIEAGLRLAGLVRPVPTIAAAATTGEGKAALSVASVAAAASAAAPAIQAVAGLPQWVGVAAVIAVAAVAVAVVLTQRRSAPV